MSKHMANPNPKVFPVLLSLGLWAMSSLTILFLHFSYHPSLVLGRNRIGEMS